jgi:AAA ATPase domain
VRSPRGASVRLLADALELTGRQRQRFEEAASLTATDAAVSAAGSTSESTGTAVCQLPPDVADFIGRAEQIELVRNLLARVPDDKPPTAVVVSAVAGKAGVGKTALALHIAHRLRDRFPDGQLYVNLHGAEQHPVQAAAVLGRFLRALGVDGAAIPLTRRSGRGCTGSASPIDECW